MRLIFDAHLDLAWNAVFFHRDLDLPLEEIRRREQGMNDELSRGRSVLCLPELRAAGVAVCVATLLARSGPDLRQQTSYKRTDLDYVNQAGAFAAAQGQLAWYLEIERQGALRILRTRGDLVRHWQAYAERPATEPLGIILSMEGADPIVAPSQLDLWRQWGLRACGPAHYGRSHYACGTGTAGPLSPRGRALLEELGKQGMILDVTHLADESMAEALDRFSGPVLASHHNCRALVAGERQITDEQILRVVKRGGVIGIALDAWMMVENWVRGVSRPEMVGLAAAVDHIDHLCQLAGNCDHVALGTDLDGGFGNEQTPYDLRRYTEIRQLESLLAKRGYAETAIDKVFFGNWLRFFGAALPV